MSSARTDIFGQQRRTVNDDTHQMNRQEAEHNPYAQSYYQEEQILVHLNDGPNDSFVPSHIFEEGQRWQSEAPVATHKAASRTNSRSYTSRMSRQKSRRRELLGRQVKPGITVDTSFTRHKGTAPHQVFPHGGERSSASIRKSPWFGLGRSSTRNKGLGITKGTPQPEITHRTKASIDNNDATAISLNSSKPWQDISPWDRRIPIGISVPTESVSDFSSYQQTRQRAGSDVTLVTPSIIITPAEAMQSVWSPDTPFTESDYTPSTYSRYAYNSSKSDVPPVPALPAGLSKSSDIPSNVELPSTKGEPNHVRNDTLDSAGTAFEEYDDSRKKDRIMSSGTVFEEDDTPLRERTIETSLAIDTSMVPTPRRSQGWWNVITTPFVTTPNTATWTQNGLSGERTPDVPTVPTQFGLGRDAPPSPSIQTWSPLNSASREPAPLAITPAKEPDAANIPAITIWNAPSANATQPHTQQNNPGADRSVAVPLSTMSATSGVSTAALGAVSMPRSVDEQPRQININIELQDRRPIVNNQTILSTESRSVQQVPTFMPTVQHNTANAYTQKTGQSSQTLPVFAPPPMSSHKSSHFSYDVISRSSSPGSTPDLKAPKKHRKVCNISSMFPFGNRKSKKNQDPNQEKKKKKRGVCFWGCCCCLWFFILIAIIIPVVVVLLRKHNQKPTGTTTNQDVGSQWLNLTNYPAIPTGILTIAQPEAVEEESGCVAPTTLWSCALPKELQASVKPNKPDQPNFKIEITFQNGTSATLPTAQRVKRAANPVSAGAFIRSLLRARAAPSPSPAPPSNADMSFLGQTTDGNTAPFEGETTPLFISFKDSTISASRLAKRANSSDPTNITSVIPPPMLSNDGSAAPANLLPLPTAQPLRLFNRGTDNEYYGFYTYFDRSIFLKQINGTNRGGNPADTNGGSTRDAANLRCTYAETRFLVQIWTRSKNSKPLLQNAASSSSNVFSRPGTFPYPVTFTMDRHGGNAAKKNLYCYEMEGDGTIKNEASKRSFQFEDRAFGGNLVNGTQGKVNVSGPIDGGTGGCRCQWQNWLN